MLLDRRQYLRRIGEHVVVSAKDTKFTCASGTKRAIAQEMA